MFSDKLQDVTGKINAKSDGQFPDEDEDQRKKPGHPKIPPRLIGFPRTEAVASMFSAVTEKIYKRIEEVRPESDLVDMPRGDPPSLEKIYGKEGLQPGHVCVVGPTGSGKSTIVRSILCQLVAQRTLSIYTLEFPVEVSLNTHGLFDVCQIDMLQTVWLLTVSVWCFSH
jgi:hypothetical protein